MAIRVFLADGTPQGLRIVERMGWTGLCLAFARADYQSARLRDEIGRTGVYVLVGPDPGGRRGIRVYVGEADAVRTRLDQHHREKDFWTDAYILTTTDNSLNKAQVRYLESRLLELARDAAAATIDNGTAPAPTWLSEPDIAVMDTYLDYSLALLPLLGVNLFEVIDETEESVSIPALADWGVEHEDGGPPAPVSMRPLLHLRTVLTEAEGRDEARGFVVYEGSKARRQENVMLPGYQQLRHRLIEEGALEPITDEQFRLTKPVVFDSPSAAASVMSGGSKNGRIEWRDARGVTLKELQERATAMAVGPSEEPEETVPTPRGEESCEPRS